MAMYNSETSKHRHLAAPYCAGNGVDLGSAGDPIVPTAIQFDLPEGTYGEVLGTQYPIQWRGDATQLPFKDGVLDYVASSHLLEDFADWKPVLAEWDRVLKRGGYMIISVPDHARFRAAVAAGQGDNCAHKKESRLGEIPEHLPHYHTIMDRFVNDNPKEYSILYIGRKPL
jgi:SAM-dependent methyltransferase